MLHIIITIHYYWKKLLMIEELCLEHGTKTWTTGCRPQRLSIISRKEGGSYEELNNKYQRIDGTEWSECACSDCRCWTCCETEDYEWINPREWLLGMTSQKNEIFPELAQIKKTMTLWKIQEKISEYVMNIFR